MYSGNVIAEEAGCLVTDIDGHALTYDGPLNNPEILQRLIDAVVIDVGCHIICF